MLPETFFHIWEHLTVTQQRTFICVFQIVIACICHNEELKTLNVDCQLTIRKASLPNTLPILYVLKLLMKCKCKLKYLHSPLTSFLNNALLLRYGDEAGTNTAPNETSALLNTRCKKRSN